MNIYLLGTNHKTADVEFREKLAIAEKALPEALKTLHDYPQIDECLVLSTCNRTEIYVVSSETSHIYDRVQEFLKKYTGLDLSSHGEKFYQMQNELAIKHLFEVAAGLDSLILGEPQILGQLKSAFRVASYNLTTSSILNRLLHLSFTVGKRTRNETGLGAGAVSVAYASVELAQKIFKNLNHQTALLIGAGETGELTARHLRDKGIGKLYITNRTFDKAENIANELNGEAVEFENMHETWPKVDIIIGAATAPDFIINRASLEKKMDSRKGNLLFLIDIGVPRNFDPEINKIDSVFLHDIDSLQQIIDQNLEKRKSELPKAQAIINEEMSNFNDWLRSLEVTPTLVSLREKFEEIRQLEMSKHRSKLTDAEMQKIEMVTRGMMNKYLHLPTTLLREYNNGNLQGILKIEVLRELFGLEEKSE